jgi:5-methylcytosine-specific restriction endonuclease McrA
MGKKLDTSGYDEYLDWFWVYWGYYFCERCKENENDHILSRHHIFFRSEKPNHPNLHNHDNIILLCEKCHDLAHGDKSIREKWGEKWEKAKALFLN